MLTGILSDRIIGHFFCVLLYTLLYLRKQTNQKPNKCYFFKSEKKYIKCKETKQLKCRGCQIKFKKWDPTVCCLQHCKAKNLSQIQKSANVTKFPKEKQFKWNMRSCAMRVWDKKKYEGPTLSFS